MEELAKEDLDLIILNFANPDMVGHTGVIPAATRAVETVGQLLDHYPRRYLDLDEVSTVEELVDGELVTLVVQVEAAEAVQNAAEIAAVDGIDGIFIGPSDLAASMGVLGQQEHPDVVAAVVKTIEDVKAAGKFVGVNAFVEASARRYIDAGADFVNVGADVALLARGTEALAAKYIPEEAGVGAEAQAPRAPIPTARPAASEPLTPARLTFLTMSSGSSSM